jgi:hypothetical protein
MHKDREGPLVLGPIWDLNEAFGLCCGYPIEGVLTGSPMLSCLLCTGDATALAYSRPRWPATCCKRPWTSTSTPTDLAACVGMCAWHCRL